MCVNELCCIVKVLIKQKKNKFIKAKKKHLKNEIGLKSAFFLHDLQKSAFILEIDLILSFFSLNKKYKNKSHSNAKKWSYERHSIGHLKCECNVIGGKIGEYFLCYCFFFRILFLSLRGVIRHFSPLWAKKRDKNRANGSTNFECESWHFHNLRLLFHWFHFDSAINTYVVFFRSHCAFYWKHLLYALLLVLIQFFFSYFVGWCAENNLLIFRWVYISNKYTREF